MHHLNYTSPAALLIPGILGRKEGGRHSQNKLKGNSSPLWFVGMWCVLASEMLLIHEIYIGSRGTGEIHISKKSLYLLGHIRYNTTSSSRSFLSYKSLEKKRAAKGNCHSSAWFSSLRINYCLWLFFLTVNTYKYCDLHNIYFYCNLHIGNSPAISFGTLRLERDYN